MEKTLEPLVVLGRLDIFLGNCSGNLERRGNTLASGLSGVRLIYKNFEYI
jgi:hypothetical protein